MYSGHTSGSLKVCDLTQFYSPVSGGVKRYISEKIAWMRVHAPGDEHLLIIPGECDEMIRDGPSTTCTIRSPLISRTSRYRALLRLGAVERILERERPDVIESGDPYQMAWKAIASGNALRIPVVGFYHSHFPEAYLRSVAKYFGNTATEFTMDLSRRYVRNLYNKFARTLVPSPALASLLESWGVANVENIDLGVNIDVFKPASDSAATRIDLTVPPDKVVLGYIGRLAPEKNTRTLFDAFALLMRDHPGRFHLLISGDGQQRAALEKLRSVHGAAITWLPYCRDSHRLAQLYRAMDLFVHPGIQETFGLVTLEAQACGTPVVGIRGSYMDRIIQSDQSGWACENNPAALAAAILHTTESGIADLRESVSRRVRERYSWNHVFTHLFSIYRSLHA